MHVTHVLEFNKRKKADALVIPYWQGTSEPILATKVNKKWPSILKNVLIAQDFKGKEGETLFVYVEDQCEARLCLLGLGEKPKIEEENVRSAFSALFKACVEKRFKHINVLLPESTEKVNEPQMIRSLAEGLFLTNYFFKKYKTTPSQDDVGCFLESITFIGPYKAALKDIESVETLCEGVYLTRDLVNSNADEITPSCLAQKANLLFSKSKQIKVTLFDEKRLEKEKMGLLLAVARGSSTPPRMIIIEYHGNPKSKEKVVFVGKGITYDTGGLNLKPTGSMETMKSDMSGAAVCLGAMKVVCDLKLKVNFSVVIPATENAVDAKSYKPGDVYTSYLGKSVEMTNSDAEGRLILADALAYATKKLHPTLLIDMATLTGAIDIALGPEAAGLMSTDDQLSAALIEAGEKTHERLWRMPLFDEYKEKLKSDIADLKSWNGRAASSSVAATFLRAFVDEKIPWAHIDIASTAFTSEAKKYIPKYATGFGVRLIVQFLKDFGTRFASYS